MCLAGSLAAILVHVPCEEISVDECRNSGTRKPYERVFFLLQQCRRSYWRPDGSTHDDDKPIWLTNLLLLHSGGGGKVKQALQALILVERLDFCDTDS